MPKTRKVGKQMDMAMAVLRDPRLKQAIDYLNKVLKNPPKELNQYEIVLLNRQLDLLSRTAKKDEAMAAKLAENFGLTGLDDSDYPSRNNIRAQG